MSKTVELARHLEKLHINNMYKTDFYWTWDKTDDEIDAVFTVADALRDLRERNKSTKIFNSGLGISLFRDNSTRTRFSFASACNFLGLEEQVLDEKKSQIAHGETVRETANMVSFMADVIGIRDDMYIHQGHEYQKTFMDALEEGYRDGILEQRPTLVNLQCDVDHPTQCMADMLHVIHYFGGVENLKGKKVAIIGYGSQGHAHSENLAESGVNVVVGLRKGSAHWEKASEFAATHPNFKVMEVEEAAKAGDVVMMLVPDELCADIYNTQVAPYMTEGKALAFAHGFNIHFKTITAPKNVDVIMIAPKGPGHIVRRLYTEGEGCPSLICVEQDYTGKAKDIALAYASGIGAGRAGILQTTFKEETETDLFGEQAVLCGGIVELMRCGFETLVEAGYEPENAYFECIHEMKLIVDLINKGGVAAMNYSISDTAEYGEYVSGPRILPYEQTKANMKAVLNDIQDGTFAGKWIAENKNGRCFFNSHRDALAKHPMEVIGKQLREQMLWKNDSNLDNASN